jgi:DNA-binding NtrC family response regulator
VRELKNVVERAVMFCAGAKAMEVRHLPEEIRREEASPTSKRAPEPQSGLRGELDAFEKQRIIDALERCAGNQTKAAAMLGISRRTLLSRLDAHALPRPRK